jgi:hypothetical protein
MTQQHNLQYFLDKTYQINNHVLGISIARVAIGTVPSRKLCIAYAAVDLDELQEMIECARRVELQDSIMSIMLSNGESLIYFCISSIVVIMPCKGLLNSWLIHEMKSDLT